MRSSSDRTQLPLTAAIEVRSTVDRFRHPATADTHGERISDRKRCARGCTGLWKNCSGLARAFEHPALIHEDHAVHHSARETKRGVQRWWLRP